MTGASAAFLRFSRDKRGYEHFYLVQPTTNRRGKTRSRILYWFRTPPSVRVGRLPFDEDVRRALESQNPGVAFDWKKLLATPIPPPAPDVERWRERRRLERAEKAARRALAAPVEGETPEPENDDDDSQPGVTDAAAPDGELELDPESTAVGEAESLDEPLDVAQTAQTAQTAAAQPPAPAGQPGRKRRRRRRGGRRNEGPAKPNPPASNGGE